MSSTKTIVVKIGGGVNTDPVLDDIAALSARSVRVVLVHGGGPAVDQLASDLGVPSATIVSPDGTCSRRTDPVTLDVLTMALLGRVKPSIVEGLRARNVEAVGLCGADGGMVLAQRRQAVRTIETGRARLIRDDRSGRIVHVRPALISLILAGSAVPVISPPVAAIGEQGLLNVDADRVACAVAAALSAQVLLLLSDVPGVLADVNDSDTLLSEAGVADLSFVTGRMRHKLRAAVTAAKEIPKVIIAAGAGEHPVEIALAGGGTRVRHDNV